MLVALLVVCVAAGAARGARLGAHNMTTGALVLEEHGAIAPVAGAPEAKQLGTQAAGKRSSVVAPVVEQADAQTPIIETSDDPGGGAAAKANELMFGLSPVAVPGGLEVTVVTVDAPLLPPELAALMPQQQPEQEHFQFQLIQPSPRRRHSPRSRRAGARDVPPLPSPQLRSTTTYKNVTIKKDKLQWFMKFINKHRELLKHLIENQQQNEMRAPAAGALAAAVTRPGGGEQFKFRRSGDSPAAKSGDVAPLLRSHDLDPKQLDPKKLDMAPATDMRIQHMRNNKGRLCVRNILQPEGPKYTADGRIYWKEFISTETMHFQLTKAPKFLLPACCNCCKKSALGCE